MKRIACVVMGLVVIAGCSTPAERRAREAAELAEYRLELAQKRMAREDERKNAFMGALPAWVLEKHPEDGSGVFGVGSGESDVLATAVKMARLQAEFETAKQMGQELSGSERYYEQDHGAGVPARRFTQLVDKLVAEVPVVGFEVQEQEVRSINGRYHAFVLLRLPYDEMNKVIQARRSKKDLEMADGFFSNLERRLADRRAREERDVTQSSAAAAGDAGVGLLEGRSDDDEKPAQSTRDRVDGNARF